MSKENMVETERGNHSFFSKKLESGKNKRANKKARKKGASMLSPTLIKYPIPIMLIMAKANFDMKGRDSGFIFINFV